MTEEQAKTKWCPHARCVVDAPHYASGNIFGENREKCIASDCMMWKWRIDKTGAAIANAQADVGLEPDGYCGVVK